MPQSDEKPLITNVTNFKQLEKAKSKEDLQKIQEREDILRIANMPEGRRFIWRILRQCKVLESIFEANSRIAYNAGMQDVGHFILGEVEKARPMTLSQMMQEAKDA